MFGLGREKPPRSAKDIQRGMQNFRLVQLPEDKGGIRTSFWEDGEGKTVQGRKCVTFPPNVSTYVDKS